MLVAGTIERSEYRRKDWKFWELAPNPAHIIRSVFPVLVFIFMMGVLACPAVFAQTAQVSGSITDASGAAVPNASVKALNQNTGTARTAVSNDDGYYLLPLLQPGTYTISVDHAGFATKVLSGITLEVGQSPTINITMEVGQVSQRIDVASRTPEVDLTSSTISGVVSQTDIVELPLNGRDWTQLATLEPGVDSAAAIQVPAASGFSRGSRGWGSQMSISGERPQYNGYYIDGVNVNDEMGGSPGSVSGGTLGVDAIQEFSVLTSNYPAEYGRTPGAILNAVTRSGTNQFHGTVYEFLRNNALDARNFFDGPQIPEFRRNQFGASVGGPIRKSHTFFFFDYEGLRQVLGTTNTDTVPSLTARNGTIFASDGTPMTITIDPTVQKALALWPLPNGAILPPGNTAIFSFAGNSVLPENFATARIDQTISASDTLSGTYQFDRGSVVGPDVLQGVNIGSRTSREFVEIGEIHVFSPTLLNSARVGFNRSTSVNGYNAGVINPAADDPSLSAIPGVPGAPSISVPGLTLYPGGKDASSQTSFVINAYQAYDDVTLQKGIHTLKFGVSVERDQTNSFQARRPGGVFKFGSLTNFLLNEPNSFTGAIPETLTERGTRNTIFGAYFQDDLRLRPNLTLNLGVRYEMSTPPTEVQGKYGNLRNLTDTTPALGNPLFLNPTLANFEPRIGFAWDPFGGGKTSIRGGFGIFDILPLPAAMLQLLGGGAPFALQGTATHLPAGTFPSGAFDLIQPTGLGVDHFQFDPPRAYIMQWNLNVQREIIRNLTVMVGYVGSHAVHDSVEIQDADITLPTKTPAGFLWPSCLPAACPTLNPNFGDISTLDWTGSSSYNGLIARITKRMSHGFQIEGSYTWSRTIDDASSYGIGDGFLNSISSPFPSFVDSKLNRGPADFNRDQVLTINFGWNIPGPKSAEGFLAAVAGGWQLEGIATIATGTPFTVLIAPDPLGENSSDPFDRPSLVVGPGCSSPVNPGNPTNYIKLQCFGLPLATPAIAAECTPFAPNGGPVAVGTCSNLLGNAGRNGLNGPGLVNVDFGVFKNNRITKISENFNVQFRAELFNVFNHSNFASPVDNSTVFDSTGAPVPGAGLIDQTATASRQVQFGLKIIW
jgi:hypothetical protein